MNTAIRLGSIRGVEVVMDVAVVIVAGLLGWLEYAALDATFGVGSLGVVLAGVVAVGYVGSVLAHEATHTVVAQRRGLAARRIRLLVFGGYSVIDSREATPADEFVVALAGPAASLVLGAVLWAVSAAAAGHEPTSETFRFLAVLNLVVAGFNVLPGLPLDGGRALRAALWNSGGNKLRATELAATAGRILGLGVSGIGLFLVFRGDLTGFVWLVLGWFLARNATAAGKREELLVQAGAATARDLMRPTPDAVPGHMRIAEVASLFQIGPTLRTMPVAVAGRVKGVIGQQEIDGLAPGRRELGRADAVMTGIGPDDLIAAEAAVDAVVSRLAARHRLLVVDQGTVIGVIEPIDLERALA